jgi:di/tricarboxylate transporter
LTEQLIVFGTLLSTLLLFVSGRLRYDVVALLALMAVTLTGVIPHEEAFVGFGHPAVVTVAAILVVSRGLLNGGAVDVLAGWISRVGDRPVTQVMVLTSVVAISSGFMNNVGALALLMPVAIRIARKSGVSASKLLMPLAFGSLLGGMTTLIGTPPNIIIATFRAETAAVPFRMFDFTPVGVGVALVGIAYLVLIGWRLIPQREGTGSRQDLFEIGAYTTEVRIPQRSPLVGKMVREIKDGADVDIIIVALRRGQQPIHMPSAYETFQADDTLVVEAAPEDLQELVELYKLELVGSGIEESLEFKDMSIVEAIVTPNSPIVGRSPSTLNLRRRYGVNLLAVARQGERVRQRLSKLRFQAGDVLLLQTHTDALADVLAALGCLPLAGREIGLGRSRRLLVSVVIFAAALVAAAVGVLPIAVAMVGAAVAMVVVGVLTLKEAYDSINWPIIILLGAMIPVGHALEVSGGAEAIANSLLSLGSEMPAAVTLTFILVATMFLSDVINNAAAAVLMAPIAISVAQGLSVSADAFLMAVAIGASCAFLTPIGHQSNTLVMGPGGYRFGDYWRVGLLLEVVVVLVSIPLLLLAWPL